MRVLFWCDAYPPAIGGIPSIAADLVAALRERGHELHVVTDGPHGGAPSCATSAGVAIHRYPFYDVVSARDAAGALALGTSIAALERRVQPDVVLAFAVSPSLFFYLQARRVWPAPLLVTIHGGLPFRAGSADGLVGRIFAAADWIIACSEDSRRNAVDYYPSIAGKSSVVRNALAQPAPPPSRLSLDPLRLLYVGRLSHEKGVDLALAAMPAVLAHLPDASLRIVGDGPYAATLRERAEEHDLCGCVEFRGFVARDEVRRLLSESSIVLVPSRDEGFSLVALEAAQAGRPVVAARVGGIPEVVIDGETGILVAAEAPRALAAAILQLAEDPAAARHMAGRALRHASNAFRWTDYVDAYDDRIRALGKG